jgi:hypothetical protein
LYFRPEPNFLAIFYKEQTKWKEVLVAQEQTGADVFSF